MQSSITDEFIYHEALVHPALAAQGAPRRVLVLGGGAAAIAFTLRADVVALWAAAARFLMKFAAIVGGA